MKTLFMQGIFLPGQSLLLDLGGPKDPKQSEVLSDLLVTETSSLFFHGVLASSGYPVAG